MGKTRYSRMKIMKNFRIILLWLLLLVVSCGPIKHVPVQTIINYKDSTIVHVDSIAVDVPVERYVDIVNELDTLVLETSVAKAIAYADTTTRTLKGEIKNKPVQLKKEIVYQDRVIEKEVYKDKPVYVEVEKIKTKHPFYEPILWLFALLSIGYISIKLVRRYLIKV